MTRYNDGLTAPVFDSDTALRVGYLAFDNTHLVARTEDLNVDPSGRFSLLADFSESGELLGIEVMW